MLDVLFDRLIDMACVNPDEIWAWPDAEPITLQDVIDAKAKGVSGNAEPYGDIWKHPVKESRDKEYHVARIIYFMDHPEEISGIEIDNPCVDHGILPGCEIVDGWHRIAAAILLSLQKVSISYGGRADVEDYLSGKTDKRPDEILVL